MRPSDATTTATVAVAVGLWWWIFADDGYQINMGTGYKVRCWCCGQCLSVPVEYYQREVFLASSSSWFSSPSSLSTPVPSTTTLQSFSVLEPIDGAAVHCWNIIQWYWKYRLMQSLRVRSYVHRPMYKRSRTGSPAEELGMYLMNLILAVNG